MQEFRPQQMSSRPIFMIAFTIIAVVYLIWTMYETLFTGASVNWFTIAFIFAVIAILWYSRMTATYYVRITDERISWRIQRNSDVFVEAKNVKAVEFLSLSIVFDNETGVEELSLANFDSGDVGSKVREAIWTWALKNNLQVEGE